MPGVGRQGEVPHAGGHLHIIGRDALPLVHRPEIGGDDLALGIPGLGDRELCHPQAGVVRLASAEAVLRGVGPHAHAGQRLQSPPVEDHVGGAEAHGTGDVVRDRLEPFPQDPLDVLGGQWNPRALPGQVFVVVPVEAHRMTGDPGAVDGLGSAALHEECRLDPHLVQDVQQDAQPPLRGRPAGGRPRPPVQGPGGDPPGQGDVHVPVHVHGEVELPAAHLALRGETLLMSIPSMSIGGYLTKVSFALLCLASLSA